MKKRTISLFLVISMSFTLFYPSLSLNDNVIEYVDEEGEETKTVKMDGTEISFAEFIRLPGSEKKFKLRLLEWINEICG